LRKSPLTSLTIAANPPSVTCRLHTEPETAVIHSQHPIDMNITIRNNNRCLKPTNAGTKQSLPTRVGNAVTFITKKFNDPLTQSSQMANHTLHFLMIKICFESYISTEICFKSAGEIVPFLLNDISKTLCDIGRIQWSKSEPSAPRLQCRDDLTSIVANETKSGTLCILLDDCHCRERFQIKELSL